MSAGTGGPPLGLDLAIRDVTCQPTGFYIDPSRKYSLMLDAKPPASCSGLQKEKSAYATLNESEIFWRKPFGTSFSLVCPTSDAHITITLRQHHTIRPSRNIGACTVDFSTLRGTQTIQSPLVSDQGVQLAVLTITATVASVDVEAAMQKVFSVESKMKSAPIDLGDRPQPGLTMEATAPNTNGLWRVLGQLDGFMRIANVAAEIHPWVKLAWGVVSVAYKAYKMQTIRDSCIQQLIREMDESCQAAKEAAPLRDRSSRSNGVIVKILLQVMQCTYFVKEYCSERSFGMRFIRDIMSLVDQQARDYIANLQDLRRNLCGQASINAAVMVYRVFDKLEDVGGLELLKEMTFATQAFGDVEERCLDGTRTEIIDAIVRWAVHADSPNAKEQTGRVLKSSARVLWLCGVAGSGKSRISRSVAARLQKLQRLGSLYCCDYKNKASLNPDSLFSTIAQHLSDRDPLRKKRLIAAIKEDKTIRTTRICRQQYWNFIVAPSVDLPIVGDTMIVIDAFDEIGSIEDRAVALDILTRHAHELPPGLRVVVTSRFEDDIQEALRAPHVDYMLMDDIPPDITARDIHLYVHDTLGDISGLKRADLDNLAKAAGDSFQWISTACRYIRNSCDGRGTWGPRDRLPLFLASNQGVDELYTRILDEHFGAESPEGLEKVKLVLGLILGAAEPISLRTLSQLIPRDLSDPNLSTNFDNLHRIVRHLASLLVNTHDVDRPISPLHASFADFLQDMKRHHKYLIDIEKSNNHLTVGCLEVMERELRFNICQIPTSYVTNKDIGDLGTLVNKHISPHLRYASHFWAQHLSRLMNINDVISSKLMHLLSSRFLEWLEVMSVTEVSFQAPLAAINLSKISHGGGDLASLIHDLKQFASVFATPIHQSVPHIYLSALAFAPTSSALHGHRKRFPKTVILRQGQMVDWPRLVHVFAGHTGWVNAVAISPDGSLMVSASNDRSIRFWSTATGVVIGEPLWGHSGLIRTVAFSPDGAHVASGSNDNSVRLWSAKSFVSIGGPLNGHRGPITSVAFSPDGSCLASASQDKTIRLWSALTGSPIGTPLVGHEQDVKSVVFSPSGDFLFSGSYDNTIRIWSVADPSAVGEPLQGHSKWVTCIAFSPDGARFASGSNDATIQLWNSQTFVVVGKPLQGHFEIVGEPLRGHLEGVACLAFSPDSTLIASGSMDHTIRLWDAITGSAIGEPLRGHAYGVTSLAFLPDGLQLVSGSHDHTIRLWNTARGAAFGEPSQHTDCVSCISISGDGKYIASGSDDNTVRVWDATLGIAVGKPFRGHGGHVRSVAFSTNGTIIASGSCDSNSVIYLRKTLTGELVNRLTGHGKTVKSIVFTPDGKQIVSGSEDSTIRRWNAATGALIGEPLRGHNDWVASVAVSPDGTLIASASWDWTIRIWDLRTGALIGKPFRGHNSHVNCVAFSPDGTKIASGSRDETIQLWDVGSQAMIGDPLKGHSFDVTSVAFSHDGSFLVSGSWDTTVRVWNVETGVEICEPLRGHTWIVTSVACSPDGIHVVSSSWDKSVRLWNLADVLAKRMIDQEYNRAAECVAPLSLSNSKALEAPSANAHGATTYPRSDIPAQYPPHLFPKQTLKIRDGWILGPGGGLLLWVPPVNRSGLLCSPWERCIGIVNTELDFNNFKCGTEWMQCREPIERNH